MGLKGRLAQPASMPPSIKSPGRSSTGKGSVKGSGKATGSSNIYARKSNAIPKWNVTAYKPPRKISDKELEAARKVPSKRRELARAAWEIPFLLTLSFHILT